MEIEYFIVRSGRAFDGAEIDARVLEALGLGPENILKLDVHQGLGAHYSRKTIDDDRFGGRSWGLHADRF